LEEGWNVILITEWSEKRGIAAKSLGCSAFEKVSVKIVPMGGQGGTRKKGGHKVLRRG